MEVEDGDLEPYADPLTFELDTTSGNAGGAWKLGESQGEYLYWPRLKGRNDQTPTQTRAKGVCQLAQLGQSQVSLRSSRAASTLRMPKNAASHASAWPYSGLLHRQARSPLGSWESEVHPSMRQESHLACLPCPASRCGQE